MKLLADGFTTEITRADQELRGLVRSSVTDLFSDRLRRLAKHLTARRRAFAPHGVASRSPMAVGIADSSSPIFLDRGVAPVSSATAAP